jgi:putative acetyltransferase
MLIRAESPDEEDAIDALTRRAFAPMPFSDQREAEILRALRRDGTLALSLVAVEESEIVGHVAFSPVTIDGVHNDWFGLGPISVSPERQRQGIGRALVRAGLETLQASAANGCALIGNPAIYSRFGFVSNGRLQYPNTPAHLVQHIVFQGQPSTGTLKFATAFDA